jgi:hypothetical protein
MIDCAFVCVQPGHPEPCVNLSGGTACRTRSNHFRHPGGASRGACTREAPLGGEGACADGFTAQVCTWAKANEPGRGRSGGAAGEYRECAARPADGVAAGSGRGDRHAGTRGPARRLHATHHVLGTRWAPAGCVHDTAFRLSLLYGRRLRAGGDGLQGPEQAGPRPRTASPTSRCRQRWPG